MPDIEFVKDTTTVQHSSSYSSQQLVLVRELDQPPSHAERVALSERALAAAPVASSHSPNKKPVGVTVANGGGGPGGSGGCRLLWRGRLTRSDEAALHGVAIIAHLFTVSSALHSPLAPASSLSPFDDPFSSASSAFASGADLCLGLEMLRGAPIAVLGDVRVRRSGDLPDKHESFFVERGSKGKGRARDDLELELVEIETPTDVRVYIDGRCPETVEWFEDRFCREGRAGLGIRLDAGDEEVILFASLPAPAEEERENRDPSASSSSAAATSLPPLTLLLGRRARATKRKPRPDDPLPRENLFANKLRKTASLPVSAFSLLTNEAAPPPLKRAKRQTAKDKVIASLLGKDNGMAPLRSRAPTNASQTEGVADPVPAPAPTRPFVCSATSRFPSDSLSASASLYRQKSLPPDPTTISSHIGQMRANASGGRRFQRTASRSSMLLESPPGSDDDVNDGESKHDARTSIGQSVPRRATRPPSPAPSLASALCKRWEDQEHNAEESDAVTELKSFTASSRGRAHRIRGLARSSSLPVGQFALGLSGVDTGETGSVERGSRETTALPSVRASSVAPVKEGPAEARNKNTVKKLTLERMVALGYGKTHAEFRDVFSFTTRGVGFAMRATFKSSILSPQDRELAAALIEQHLRLYLPSPASSTSFGSSEACPSVGVKNELMLLTSEASRLPSPKSLDEGDEEASISAQTSIGLSLQANGAKRQVYKVEEKKAQVNKADEEYPSLHPEETPPSHIGEQTGASAILMASIAKDEEEELDEVVLVNMPSGTEVKTEGVEP